MNTTRPDLEALQLALKMEKDGYKFFSDARDKTEHPLAKETFDSLAKWEIEHIKIIEKFYSTLENTGAWEAVDVDYTPGQSVEKFKTIFQQHRESIDETVKTDTDVLEAYKFARDVEDKLLVFYQQKAEEATDENAITFYKFMSGQEREHHVILDNSLRYLKDPAGWAAEEENWMFDGG
jgi:rubrerythrin